MLLPSFKINAEEWGAKLARRMFEKRGNKTEIHLSERELAAITSFAFALGQDCHVAEGKALKTWLAKKGRTLEFKLDTSTFEAPLTQ